MYLVLVLTWYDFSIVQFPGSPKFVLSGDHLYLEKVDSYNLFFWYLSISACSVKYFKLFLFFYSFLGYVLCISQVDRLQYGSKSVF